MIALKIEVFLRYPKEQFVFLVELEMERCRQKEETKTQVKPANTM